MKCPYCNKDVELVYGNIIYPHRPDLYKKLFYLCGPCKAYVGCHPGTDKPLGRLANSELRIAKQLAHSSFDPMWRNGKQSRSNAYSWLAEKLSIEKKECHIGMFDIEMCNKVVEICNSIK